MDRTYIAIDLKSFYASVECVERGFDPLRTNLVVADISRTEKTICLAVTPSLKKIGVPGRARLFEANEHVRRENARRRAVLGGREFSGSSSDAIQLERCPELELTFEIACPRMALYMEYSARIYDIYLKFVAPEDIHVYSVDEVFIDATAYLPFYGLSARDFAMKMVREVLTATGITATAGIGTNLYLAKIAMDIVAKHIPADKDGVRIAALDEISYRKSLWTHEPITDFWRVGRGYAKKLAAAGMFTMGDVARCSLGKKGEYYSEDLLYDMFGIEAQLLIDHAWGCEDCTMADIKAYRTQGKSISSGQVLSCPYSYEDARVIVEEMAGELALELVRQGLFAGQLLLQVGYDAEGMEDVWQGDVKTDRYGRQVPKPAHGSFTFDQPAASERLLVMAAVKIFGETVDPSLFVRRINITARRVGQEQKAEAVQLSLFENADSEAEKSGALKKEERLQQARLSLREKFGKNSVFKGINLKKGATGLTRRGQIGGHRA